MSSWHPSRPYPETSEARSQISRWLDASQRMQLNGVAASQGAIALVSTLTDIIVAHEVAEGGRRNNRGTIGFLKLTGAAAAIVAALLRAWANEPPAASSRALGTDTFTGSPVGRRPFETARAALVARGLIVEVRGRNGGQNLDWGDDAVHWHQRGRVSRFWPSDALLSLAAEHGVSPESIKGDFGKVVATRVPKVLKLIRLKPLKRQFSAAREDDGPLILKMTARVEARLSIDVEAANAFAGHVVVTGCPPPRWYRVFSASSELGGRWTAAGLDGTYQQMSQQARTSNIVIDGEPVCEVDISSAHLTIMHGLLQLPLPEGDLYDIPRLSRELAKAWVLVTLGNGRQATRWSAETRRNYGEAIGSRKAADVAGLVVARFPFLEAPARAVEKQAGLDELDYLGEPERLLTHRLMNIEADCITTALRTLREQGVLALPVHDGLIVQRSARKAAQDALQSAFEGHAGVTPRVKASVD